MLEGVVEVLVVVPAEDALEIDAALYSVACGCPTVTMSVCDRARWPLTEMLSKKFQAKS
jgi:hypothetical protein